MGKILIMGANPETASLVIKAKQMGLETHVTDMNRNAYAKRFADIAVNIDASHADKLVEYVKENKIDGVLVGVAEALLPSYYNVCKQLNYPCYGTLEQFEVMVSKEKFKQACRRYGVPVVPEYSADDLSSVQYPVVVKPVDSYSSKGISICQSEEDLKKAIDYALSFSRSKKYIIEDFMQGDEVISYYVIQDGHPIFVGMCDRYTYKARDNVIQLPTSYIFPSKYIDLHMAHFDAGVKNLMNGLGLKNGSIFFQCFVSNDGIVRTYEAGYRLNGAQEHMIISQVSGIDAKEMYINFSLTGRASNQDLRLLSNPKPQQFGCKLSPLVRPGKIGKLKGLAEIAKLPNIVSVNPSYEEGDVVEGERTLKQIVCRFFIISENKEELIKTIREIYELIRVEDEAGNNMLIGNFDASIIENNY